VHIAIDDATRPMSVFLNAALGGLFGLGFVGYMTLWVWIRERANRVKWPQWLTRLLVGSIATLGLAVIVLAPASVLHRLRAQGAISLVGGIVFTTTILAVLCLAWLVAQDWNRWFCPRQSGKTPGR